MDRTIIEQVASDLGNERRRLKQAQQKNLERSASLLLNAQTAKIPIATAARLLRISRARAYQLMEGRMAEETGQKYASHGTHARVQREWEDRERRERSALASQAPDRES